MSESKFAKSFEVLEPHLNRQIGEELYASQVYLSMYAYFSRDQVSLPGMAQFCLKSCNEVRKD